jgi:hypothetical protein
MTHHAACTHCHAWITTPVARDAAGQPLCETCAREHGARYSVIWSGDEAGLYCNGAMIAGARMLTRAGYDVSRITGWDQRGLVRVRREVEMMLREEALT